MNTDELKGLSKNEIPILAKQLSTSDIEFLVQTLAEKDDTLRYHAFLLLQANSSQSPQVYKYWGILEEKVENTNSYQRSVGLMLIAENVQWDTEGKFGAALDKYFACCTDEKFITARQAIQGLAKVLNATSQYDGEVKQRLLNLQLGKYKENQQKLLSKDIANTLKIIEKR